MSEHSTAPTAMLIHVVACLFSLKLRRMVDYPLHQCSDAPSAPVCEYVCASVCVRERDRERCVCWSIWHSLQWRYRQTAPWTDIDFHPMDLTVSKPNSLVGNG